MRTFRPWNSSIPQPLIPVESFAILARDGRVIPVETAVPADGARLAVHLSESPDVSRNLARTAELWQSRSVGRRLAIQRAPASDYQERMTERRQMGLVD